MRGDLRGDLRIANQPESANRHPPKVDLNVSSVNQEENQGENQEDEENQEEKKKRVK